jgi:uncharacterized membrane protein YkvA (DUF1232 family)
MQATIAKWQAGTKRLRAATYALYLAYRDPRVPWYAKVFAALVVGYAFSPIDLIPDFIPVLGYLDDLILVPAGVAIALRMIPPLVMEEAQARAQIMMDGGTPVNRYAAVVVVSIWLAIAIVGIAVMVRVVGAS